MTGVQTCALPIYHVAKGRRAEPITVYAESPPNLLRRLGGFDTTPEPDVHELEAWLVAGETIRGDPARLFRSRPGAGRWQNPLAEKDGQPGVVFRWLEVEGPLYDTWPTAGQKLLFGDLPVVEHLPPKRAGPSGKISRRTRRKPRATRNSPRLPGWT